MAGTIHGWVKDMLEKMQIAEGMPCNAQQLPEWGGWEMLSFEEALASFELKPYPPSVEDVTCILLKCRKEKNPTYTLRLNAYYMRKTGLEANRFVGNYLVPMLMEGGRICHAEHVFNRLVDGMSILGLLSSQVIFKVKRYKMP